MLSGLLFRIPLGVFMVLVFGVWKLHAHAGGYPEGSGDGGEYSDDDVQDFSPSAFVFHFSFVF